MTKRTKAAGIQQALSLLVVFALGSTPLWPAPGDLKTFRLQAIDAADAPRILALMDVRSTRPGTNVLNPNEFRLREDGITTGGTPRSVSFRDTKLGVALVVALDASGSMSGKPIAAVRQGLDKLVARKRPQDRVAVLSFADDVRWEAQWDADDDALRTAFANLATRGRRTVLYQAVLAAVDKLAAQSGRDSTFPKRQAILVISDGQDAGSGTPLRAVLERVEESRIHLDAAAVGYSPNRFDALRRMTEAGFGALAPAATPEKLTEILEHGLDTLLDAEVLEFESEKLALDDRTHTLGLDHLPSAARADLRVHVPAPPWWRSWKIFAAGGVLMLVALSLAGLMLRKKKNQGVAASPSTVERGGAPSGWHKIGAPADNTPGAQPASQTNRLPTEVVPGLASGLRAAVQTASPSAVRPPATVVQPPILGDTLTPYRTPTLRLHIVSGPHTGVTVEVPIGEFWIGANSNNHLCLDLDTSVSGHHACLRSEGSVWRIYDNCSLNNTYRNGQLLEGQVSDLTAGDYVRIGQTDILVEAV